MKNLNKESNIQSRLRHPNIIRLLHYFETIIEIYLVTECADTDLNKYMRLDSRLNEDKAQQLTWDLMSALYYLHSNRILHRDIKPANILLNADGTGARLCDFGLARRMTIQTYLLMSAKGTPLYMAPEVISGPYDYKADFWSIGCVVYEMLVGKPPFSANNIIDFAKVLKEAEVNWPTRISADSLGFLKVGK